MGHGDSTFSGKHVNIAGNGIGEVGITKRVYHDQPWTVVRRKDQGKRKEKRDTFQAQERGKPISRWTLKKNQENRPAAQQTLFIGGVDPTTKGILGISPSQLDWSYKKFLTKTKRHLQTLITRPPITPSLA